jgi:hypothetical protein
MKKFTNYLTEQKNTHMEHLEDGVLNDGVKGARDAINFLQSLRDMLAGNSDAAIDTTVKWDGAPAIFAGIDPTDGVFFVAKKGIFNKNPKIYKTEAEIDADLSGDLGDKFKLALRHLPELGIDGVVQGDFLYSFDTLKNEKINGEKVVTFHPNTIVYSVPYNSDLGRTIRTSKIGIVWHTTYTGDSFESLKASFGKDISSKLNKSKNVWHQDATFHDVSGKATMTADETKQVTSMLSAAGKMFRKVDARMLKTISSDENLKMRIKAHFNTKVRAGEKIANPKLHVKDLTLYLADYWDKQIDKVKTERSKEPKRAAKEEQMKFIMKNQRSLENMFTMMNYIIDAKEMIIRKMDQASTIDTLLRTSKGFEVTAPEGYVAINRDGSAVKLVNRMEFSRANFSSDVIKGWEK